MVVYVLILDGVVITDTQADFLDSVLGKVEINAEGKLVEILESRNSVCRRAIVAYFNEGRVAFGEPTLTQVIDSIVEGN